MNKQTLHILHVYFSQVWELSSIIYSLLFLFCILFIVSTQIAASRVKNLKGDVWTLWLDIAIWSLSQKGKLDFSILPIDVMLCVYCDVISVWLSVEILMKSDKTNPVSTSVRTHKQVRQPALCKYLNKNRHI
jgi:hypothetical protein